MALGGLREWALCTLCIWCGQEYHKQSLSSGHLAFQLPVLFPHKGVWYWNERKGLKGPLRRETKNIHVKFWSWFSLNHKVYLQTHVSEETLYAGGFPYLAVSGQSLWLVPWDQVRASGVDESMILGWFFFFLLGQCGYIPAFTQFYLYWYP